MTTCEHADFSATCAIHRCVREGIDEVPFKFILEVSVQCVTCGTHFVFDWSDIADPSVVPGLGDVHRPYTNFVRDTLCAPILPKDRLEEILHACASTPTALDPSPSSSKH
jgi:hypothetical protein